MEYRPETPMTATGAGSTVFRPATVADRDPLRRLAELDSAPQLTGEVLVAERAGELVAAIAVGSGSVIADPFQPTLPAVTLLALQRRALDRAPTARRWRRLRPGRRRHEDLTPVAGVGA